MRFNFLFINLFLNLSIFYLFLVNYNPLCINSYFYLPLNSLRNEEGIYITFLLLGIKSEFISPLIEDVISFLFISFFLLLLCSNCLSSFRIKQQLTKINYHIEFTQEWMHEILWTARLFFFKFWISGYYLRNNSYHTGVKTCLYMYMCFFWHIYNIIWHSFNCDHKTYELLAMLDPSWYSYIRLLV